MEPMNCMRTDEQVALKLRCLFEEYGFSRTKVAEFEEYDLYVDHRSFFHSQNVITFMDATGKSMALRPDVTLSILKNIPPEISSVAKKLYYLESVYRFGKENKEYYKVNQIGVESIGGDEALENLEMISLALESLATISPDFRLTLSHMGFMSGILDALSVSREEEREIYALIHAKNCHDLAVLLKNCQISPRDQERVLAIVGLSGTVEEVLPKARRISLGQGMEKAILEIEALYAGLCGAGYEAQCKKIRLDFSLVNDLDYYNSLVFSGYIDGMPKVVVTGGRYDSLMRNLGKKNGGIGFAVALDDINRRFGKKQDKAIDKVIFYPEGESSGIIMKALVSAREDGSRVRAESILSKDSLAYPYKTAWQIKNGELMEGKPC